MGKLDWPKIPSLEGADPNPNGTIGNPNEPLPEIDTNGLDARKTTSNLLARIKDTLKPEDFAP